MKNEKYNKLVSILRDDDVVLSPDFYEKAIVFHEQVSTWNTYASLVSKGDLNDGLWGHTIDSLTLLPYLPLDCSQYMYVDVGTGGGFPAIPILLTKPGFRMTYLFERNKKKATYLRKLLRVLEVADVEVIDESFPESVPIG